MYPAAHPNFVMVTPAQQPTYWQPAATPAHMQYSPAIPLPAPAMHPAYGPGWMQVPQPQAPTMPYAPMPQAFAPPPQSYVMMPPAPAQQMPYYQAIPAPYAPQATTQPPISGEHLAPSQLPAQAPARGSIEAVVDESAVAVDEIRSQLRAFAHMLDQLKAARSA